MNHLKKKLLIGTAFLVLLFLISVSSYAQEGPPPPCTPSPNVSVFATGLNNPRGLKFGLRGRLFVAEGGLGGSLSTAGHCQQVPPPIGPYTGGFSARISMINREGVRTTVAEDLPSSQTSPVPVPLISGVGDVAFIGDRLYALLAGAGCSHGLAGTVNALVRVRPNGTTNLIADLSSFLMANPVAQPEPDDFEPDGTWYSMVEVHDELYALEPNHGELDKISLDGEVTRVVDFSAIYGHVVPSALATYHGNFYVGTLGTFQNNFNGMIIKVTPSGRTRVVASGLSSILGIAFEDDKMYALENQGGFPALCAGRVLRVPRSGNMDKIKVIATGLQHPTAMTAGPDDHLYVSNYGYGFPAGAGQIVRIKVERDEDEDEDSSHR